MILESSDNSDITKQYSKKTSIKIQRPTNNKIMKNKPVVISNILLSKNLVETNIDSSEKRVGLKPINKSNNVQITKDSYNVLLNCE